MQAQFLSAEKSVKELKLSVDLMKKESKKLLERTLLAEKDMTYGHNDLMYPLIQLVFASRIDVFVGYLFVSWLIQVIYAGMSEDKSNTYLNLFIRLNLKLQVCGHEFFPISFCYSYMVKWKTLKFKLVLQVLMFPLSLGCHYTRIMPSFVLRFCADLMDGLREIPNREALKLRAEASSNKISSSVALFFVPCAFICMFT